MGTGKTTVLFITAAALLFSACGRAGVNAPAAFTASKESEPAAPQPAPSTAAASRATGTSGPMAGGSPADESGFYAADVSAALPQTRMVIKAASIALLVKDIDSAFNRAVQLAEAGGGYALSSTEYYEGGERADLTLKIPTDGFLPLIEALEALGTEQNKSISGQDVTEEYYDLGARLENENAVRDRLFQLLSKAAKVADAIAVEQELERVGNTINSIQGRMKYLRNMADMSTINLSLSTEARPAVEGFINWSLVGHGFVVAARVLVQVLIYLLYALVVLIPLAAIAGGVTWVVIRVVRLGRPRKRSAPQNREG
jgi:hypothetical protein